VLISASQPYSQASANTARPQYGLVYYAICLIELIIIIIEQDKTIG